MYIVYNIYICMYRVFSVIHVNFKLYFSHDNCDFSILPFPFSYPNQFLKTNMYEYL